MNYHLMTAPIAPVVTDIRQQQKENTTAIQETQTNVQHLLEKQASDSLQSNSITILLTLGFTVTAVYFVFLKHISPRLDKAWEKFGSYLDKNTETNISLVNTTTKINEGVIGSAAQSKEGASSILSEIKCVETKLDLLKDQVVEIKMTLKKD